MNLKKIYKLGLIGMVSVLAACGGKSEETAASSSATPVKNGEKVVVNFWHSQRGAREKVLSDLVDRFNGDNEKIQVNLMFQGSYEETLNKYRSTLNTSESPNLIMIYDIGTRAMIDSDTIVPVQEFMNKDKEFDKNDFPAQIRDYYSLDGKMYSIPLGSSTAIMYYNADLLKAANIQTPPKSYKEIEEAAKLVKATTEGKDKIGMLFSTDPWPVEQYLGNNNVDYVNMENGRAGTATEVTYINGEGKAIFNWINGMVKDGIGQYYTNGKDADAAFIGGRGVVYVQSSAVLSEIQANAPFEVGVSYLPNISGEFNGSTVGGNSLWITKVGNEATQNASWEFLKYVSSPKFQAYWSTNTGYVPTTKRAYDEAEFKEAAAKNPQMMVAIDQLNSSKATAATSGASFGSFPEARANMKVAIEKMFASNESIDKILEDVAKTTNKDIERYNLVNSKKR